MNPQKALIASSLLACLLAAGAKAPRAQETKPKASTMSLDSLDGLEIRGVQEDGVDPVKTKSDVATYRGRRAVHIINDDGLNAASTPAGAQSLAIVKSSDFKDGTIELEVVGLSREGAPPTNRGFAGIAFHIQDRGARYEAIYLRMKNGRSDVQLERNHSTQYVSEPEYRWQRLRKENPGEYESYVDLEYGAWTKIKIVVAGTKARLYVNGAAEPCLIVNDLKLGDTHGPIALWTGSNSEVYFSNLTFK